VAAEGAGGCRRTAQQRKRRRTHGGSSDNNGRRGQTLTGKGREPARQRTTTALLMHNCYIMLDFIFSPAKLMFSCPLAEELVDQKQKRKSGTMKQKWHACNIKVECPPIAICIQKIAERYETYIQQIRDKTKVLCCHLRGSPPHHLPTGIFGLFCRNKKYFPPQKNHVGST